MMANVWKKTRELCSHLLMNQQRIKNCGTPSRFKSKSFVPRNGLLHVWIYLLKKAIAILMQMPITYLCEERFSNLVEIKSKKRNSIHDIDSLTRGAIEKEIKPRYL